MEETISNLSHVDGIKLGAGQEIYEVVGRTNGLNGTDEVSDRAIEGLAAGVSGVGFEVGCINRFTSLCKNLFNLLEILAEAFLCHVHHFQCLTVPVELAGKACTKNSSKLNKFLHSEVNLLIQHIIVQD